MASHTHEHALSAGQFALSPDLFCTFGEDGRIVSVNGAWHSSLGWDPEHLEGARMRALIHPEDLSAAEADFGSLSAGEPVAGLRIRVLTAHGGSRWFEWSAAIDPAGALFHAVGRDVSDRVAADAALQHERRQLEEAQALAQVGSWDWEIDTGIRSWSSQHYRNHGFEPHEFDPDPGRLIERIHPDDRAAVAEAAERISTRPGPTAIEYRVVLPGGASRVIESRCHRAESVRGSRRVLGTSRDITAEREAERVKDEFVGLVSHELRAPLTAIIGYAKLLRDFEAEALSDQGRRFLSVIERNSRRELSLVSGLLMLTQIEAGTFRIQLERVDVAELVEAAVASAAPAAREAGVRIDLEAESVPETAGDPERIAELVDNLVSNALKFTGRGGRVRVRVERGDGVIAVEVSDTGIGIALEEQPHIFDRLYRAAPAEELDVPGTGLGLAIVKAIVEAHEASISVASEPGRGSSFRVELPVRDPAEQTGELAPPEWSRTA